MSKKKSNKKDDMFFVASRSNRDQPTRVSFHDKKGNSVSGEGVDVVYRNSSTGRFISREYRGSSKTHLVGRNSRAGEFIPVKETKRRPNTTAVERVPKSGFGDTKKKSTSSTKSTSTKKIPKNSPIYFKRKKR